MQSSGEAADPTDCWPSVLLSLSIQSQPSHRVATVVPRQRRRRAHRGPRAAAASDPSAAASVGRGAGTGVPRESSTSGTSYAYVSGAWSRWNAGSLTRLVNSLESVGRRAAAVVGRRSEVQPGAWPARTRITWWNHSTQSQPGSLHVPASGGSVCEPGLGHVFSGCRHVTHEARAISAHAIESHDSMPSSVG